MKKVGENSRLFDHTIKVAYKSFDYKKNYCKHNNLFYKENFYNQRQAEIDKKLSKSEARLWCGTFVKNVQINKWGSFNEFL